jgi:hypothetical protein
MKNENQKAAWNLLGKSFKAKQDKLYFKTDDFDVFKFRRLDLLTVLAIGYLPDDNSNEIFITFNVNNEFDFLDLPLSEFNDYIDADYYDFVNDADATASRHVTIVKKNP